MSLPANELYDLLPALYRIRDIETASTMKGLLDPDEEAQLQELESKPSRSEEEEKQLQELLRKKQRGPLKALISVIAEQVDVVEADIARLLENWFIETCDPWLIPYISDLLGVRGLHTVGPGGVFMQRGRVANTLSYRRRKGTATVLEQLAFDTTGWRARAVEFFKLLATTQHYNHVRLDNHRTPDLRRTNELALLNTAFDTIAHTADVRRIVDDRGRHNIPNIGLFLWRFQSYPVTRGQARAAKGAAKGRFMFNPVGNDAPLFNQPKTEEEITHLAEEINVPGLLRRRPLYDELEKRRQALTDGKQPICGYFDKNDTADKSYPSVLKVYINGDELPVRAEELSICNLEEWCVPKPPLRASVDPVLGRITVTDPGSVEEVLVSYSYGFGGDIGGGPYDRSASFESVLPSKADWVAVVTKEIAEDSAAMIFETLDKAIQAWNNLLRGETGIIAIFDSYSYEENFSTIDIKNGRQLFIVSAKAPETENPKVIAADVRSNPGILVPKELRPHLIGTLNARGEAPSPGDPPGRLFLNGLLVEGSVNVETGGLGVLNVAHCSIVPKFGGLTVNSSNDQLEVCLEQTISGPILIKDETRTVRLKDSIVDNATNVAYAIDSEKSPLDVENCTILGAMHVRSIEASNCIFTGLVSAVRSQKGCIRFSYVPPKSVTPRQYRCQPSLEVSTQVSDETEKSPKNTLSVAAENRITRNVHEWLVPAFMSTEHGHHAYGQLSRTCPVQILTGAEDGSEMGVFRTLMQPQRAANLRTSLDEYLPFGLEAGIIYVPYDKHRL
jgi:hypothetical protein